MYTVNAKTLKTAIRRAGGKGRIIFYDGYAVIASAKSHADSYVSINVDSTDDKLIGANLALLSPLLKQFDGEITLSDNRGERINISDGSAHVSCEQVDAKYWFDAFMAIAECPATAELQINLAELKPVIDSVSQHMAISDVRSMLNGALVKHDINGYTITATDGHRLYHDELPHTMASNESESGQWIIPCEVIMQIKRCMIGNKTGIVTLRFRHNRASASFNDGTYLAFKLIDLNYPDCRRVIPAESERTRTVTVDRKQALKTVKGFYESVKRTKYQGVKITVNGSIALEHDSCEVTASASVPYLERSDAGGDDYTVGVNASYLLDALQAIDSEQVTLGFDEKHAHSSVLITGDSGSLAVVMPMRL